MEKVCYLIVLHFVIKIAFGDADENGFKCICPDPKGEFITPVVDKNVIFGELASTPTQEQKTLQRLDSIVDDLKVLVKENEKLDTVIASLSGIETIIRVKYAIDSLNTYPRNCREATKLTRTSSIYDIQVKKYGPKPFKVFCETELYGNDWTVAARRMDGSVNFADRNWTEYKEGFGDLDGEFFIGMDKLYALTNGLYTQELIIVLEDFNYERRYAKYSVFAIGDESEEYRIKALGGYSGDAGNSFSLHRNQTFQTKDREAGTKNCTRFGAWWYESCHHSNLFGSYLNGHVDESKRGIGVVWQHWQGAKYSLKFVQMMIRPKST